jgi:hypothetical protein
VGALTAAGPLHSSTLRALIRDVGRAEPSTILREPVDGGRKCAAVTKQELGDSRGWAESRPARA